jgi:hypothetical protein
MKKILLTISMAMLISVSVVPQTLTAKEKKHRLVVLYETRNISDSGIAAVGLEDWMTDPDHFSALKSSGSGENSMLEPWMLDLDHFISGLFLDNINQVPEAWMANIHHFHLPCNKPMANRICLVDKFVDATQALIVNK